MFRRVNGLIFGLAAGALLLGTAVAQSPHYKVGSAPTEEQVKAWSITILPDGTGLPEGKGTAAEGKDVYDRRCSECHGNKAQGAESVALIGGKGSLASPKPLKTVTSYWPYATTIWDYVNRAMPFDTPGVLTNDQVYAVVAYVLFLDGIVEENQELNRETLPKIQMPNRDGFVEDDRPDVGPAAHAPTR
jgi:cytochrome c